MPTCQQGMLWSVNIYDEANRGAKEAVEQAHPIICLQIIVKVFEDTKNHLLSLQKDGQKKKRE